MAKQCSHCGELWVEKEQPGFRTECLKCGAPLHACANCRFYDNKAQEWCREPQARDQKPRDVKTGNRCEYFLLAEHDASPAPSVDEPQPDWMKFDKPDTSNLFS